MVSSSARMTMRNFNVTQVCASANEALLPGSNLPLFHFFLLKSFPLLLFLSFSEGRGVHFWRGFSHSFYLFSMSVNNSYFWYFFFLRGQKQKWEMVECKKIFWLFRTWALIAFCIFFQACFILRIFTVFLEAKINNIFCAEENVVTENYS